MVFARPARNPLARRGSAAALADFLVSSMASSSDLRGAVVVADVLAGLVAARSTFALIFSHHIRTGFLGHDGGSGRRAAGAYAQQEVAPGQAPGALGHDYLLDLIVLTTTSATILEHFKCRQFKLEERFREVGDRLVETGYLRVHYCIAQRPHRRLDPPTEKPLLAGKPRLWPPTAA